MADLTDLLRLAGGESSTEPDLDAVADRAGALRRRERVLQVAAVVAAAVVVIPLLQLGGGPDALEQIPAGPRPSPTSAPVTPTPGLTSVPPASSGPDDGTVGVSATDSSGVPVGAASPRPLSSSNRSTAPRRDDPRAQPSSTTNPQAPDPGDFPQQASCQVSSTTLAPDQTATCRFTATRPGGWYFEPGFGTFYGVENETYSAEVLVDRAGQVTRFAPDFDDRCRDAVVQPGDRVTVTIQQSRARAYNDFDTAAGEGFDCSTPSRRPGDR